MNARRQQRIVNVLPVPVSVPILSSHSRSSSQFMFLLPFLFPCGCCLWHFLFVLLPLFSLWHWRHVYDFHDASVSASSTHTHRRRHTHTRSSIENTCPFNKPCSAPFWVICLMKLFACIINSFWYFTFNLTIINWMLLPLSVTKFVRICFCFLFLLRFRRSSIFGP